MALFDCARRLSAVQDAWRRRTARGHVQHHCQLRGGRGLQDKVSPALGTRKPGTPNPSHPVPLRGPFQHTHTHTHARTHAAVQMCGPETVHAAVYGSASLAATMCDCVHKKAHELPDNLSYRQRCVLWVLNRVDTEVPWHWTVAHFRLLSLVRVYAVAVLGTSLHRLLCLRLAHKAHRHLEKTPHTKKERARIRAPAHSMRRPLRTDLTETNSLTVHLQSADAGAGNRTGIGSR